MKQKEQQMGKLIKQNVKNKQKPRNSSPSFKEKFSNNNLNDAAINQVKKKFNSDAVQLGNEKNPLKNISFFSFRNKKFIFSLE